MKNLLFVLGIFCMSHLTGQQIIEGTVRDEKGVPLPQANVYLKNSYIGTLTDEKGIFRLSAQGISADDTLVIDYIGFEKQECYLKDAKSLAIELVEETNELDEVRISAGAFEASEEKRAVAINALEVVTTASSEGDIYAALATFPGAQKQGETGQLIVRGGAPYESKTFIDGMWVSSPYTSSMPDLPARGNFAPLMFNGLMFSTGGYSSEYGQALSSVLELQTPGLFDEETTSLALINVGISASHTQKFYRSAFSAELSYLNTFAYFALAKHDLNWIEIPKSTKGNFFYRQKVGKTGLLKTDVILSNSKSKLDYSHHNLPFSCIALHTQNQFIKTTYNTQLGEKMLLKTGLAYNRNADNRLLDADTFNETLSSVHGKISLINYLNKKVTLKAGVDANLLHFSSQYASIYQTGNVQKAHDWILAGYMEGDVKIYKNLALRMGLRTEKSTLTNKANLAPRSSLAYKTSTKSQLSLAYGHYYQQPEHHYLTFTSDLNYERADHYLMNYQIKNKGKVFRAEIYHKEYKHLISYAKEDEYTFKNIENNGNGFARGIDLFWKDDKSLKNTTYWISYSYINSKRLHQDYPEKAIPNFVSPHNVSVVAKYWMKAITTQISMAYSYCSGRTYFNPNHTRFMTDRTPDIHDLGINASYITDLFGHFTVVHLSVSNVLNLEHIYSYAYGNARSQNGDFMASPVNNPIRRTLILALIINLK